jgi:hypothetical protein
MSLTFDFPGFHKQWDESSSPDRTSHRSHSHSKTSETVDDWQGDLDELSGDEIAEQQQDHSSHVFEQQQLLIQPPEHFDSHRDVSVRYEVSGDVSSSMIRSSKASSMHGQQVLLLLVDLLELRDVMACQLQKMRQRRLPPAPSAKSSPII